MYRPATRLLQPFLSLLLAACTLASPFSPSPSPQSPISNHQSEILSSPSPQSSISNPQSLFVPQGQTPSPSPLPLSPLPSTPVPQSTITNHQSEILSVRPHYTLDATLSYWQHHLEVDEQIDYTNNSTDPLADLRLVVEPLRYPGVFHLDRIEMGDGKEVTGITWEGNQASIPLPQALSPGEQLTLKISYQLDLPSPVPSPDTRPVPFGYTARQINLVDWYPFIPPYIPGKGWLAHQPGYFGEHTVYEASDFTVGIRLAGSPPGLVIAASALPRQDGEWQRYHLEQARNFAFSASTEYTVQTQQVGDVTVTGYWFAFHGQAGKMALQTASEALHLYSQLFGQYPRRSLSVVEADFLDSMEYDGLFFLSYGFYNIYQGATGDYLVAIAAHETAHQWWYAQVGNDQALEPWLDEALCTYSERIYYEKLHPEGLDWWWEYRLRYGEPKGNVGGSIYDYSGEPSPYLAYRGAVYLNGALFLEDLRKAAGDQAFFSFLGGYAATFSGRIATASDFFSLLASYTSADLSSLRSLYFSSAP